MRKIAGILAIGVVAGLMWNSLSAETPEKKDLGDAPQAESGPPQIAEEIRQRLLEPITLKLDQVSVPDALEEVLRKHGFEFWLDDIALAEESIKIDEALISCNLQNVTYRAALKRILAPSNLAWVCEDAGIRITTTTNQKATLFARVYDVADLLPDPEVELNVPRGTASLKLGNTAITRGENDRGSLVGIPVQFGGGGSPPHPRSAEPTVPQGNGASTVLPKSNIVESHPAPVKNLIRAVQELVGGPESGGPWMDADGEGGTLHYIQTANSKLLVAKQNEATHAAIEDLLNDLLSHDRMGSEGAEEMPDKTASRQEIVKPRLRTVGKRAIQ